MSMWGPVGYPVNNPARPVNGYQPTHGLIEGPTVAINQAEYAAAIAQPTATTRRPQLAPAPEQSPAAVRSIATPDTPTHISGNWAAGLLCPLGGLVMGLFASAYVGVHTEPIYGVGALVLMVGLIAAIILWGLGR